MIKIEPYGSRDEIILPPTLSHPITATGKQTVQHGQIDSSFDVKLVVAGLGSTAARSLGTRRIAALAASPTFSLPPRSRAINNKSPSLWPHTQLREDSLKHCRLLRSEYALDPITNGLLQQSLLLLYHGHCLVRGHRIQIPHNRRLADN